MKQGQGLAGPLAPGLGPDHGLWGRGGMGSHRLLLHSCNVSEGGDGALARAVTRLSRPEDILTLGFGDRSMISRILTLIDGAQ